MSKLERRSVLDGHLVPGHHGAQDGKAVVLQEMLRDAVEIAAPRGEERALRQRAKGNLNLELPAIGAWRNAEGMTAQGVAPGLWFLVVHPQEPGMFASRIKGVLGETASVIETGHGLAFLTLAGRQTRHVLSKGCHLDLHPRNFQPGHAARTLIAQIPATLWQINDEPAFGLAVPLSFSQSFVHFVIAASAETGCDILPASKDRPE